MPDKKTIEADQLEAKSSEGRGWKTPVLLAATDGERRFYEDLLNEGVPEEVAFSRLTAMVNERFSQASGAFVRIKT